MKYKETLFPTVLVFVILISLSSMASAASTLRVDGQLVLSETQITTDQSNQLSPTIYNDRIVWTDSHDGIQNVYMYEISTSKEAQITTSGSTYSPVIYDDNIVWWDNRKGNFDIYTYNLSTSNEIQITTNEIGQTYPDIYGDSIVWEDDRNGGGYNSNIYVYNLSTTKETQITTNNLNHGTPAIYGDRIVWSAYDYDYRDANIYMYNLSTLTETKVTSNESGQWLPDIYGDRVVWLDDRNGKYDVYMYNLTTSEETRITTDKSLVQPRSPKIYGDRIVWEDYRNGDSDIYMYDFCTNVETQITTNKSNQIQPVIYGDKIVWSDYRNGNYDVYVCVISEKGQEPVIPTPIADFSTNVTRGYSPLSVQFTDLSENVESRIWDFNSDGTTDSNDMNPIYVYTTPRTYTVNLTVSNINGTVSKLSTIMVYPAKRISGQHILTETQVTTNKSDQYDPAVYVNKIVWQDMRNGNADIYMYDLSTCKEVQITANESDQYYPAIYGNRIVWQDMRNGNADIYMYDLSTCKEVQITTDKAGQYCPAIYGDNIVWQDMRNENYSIYLYNLATPKETQITTSEDFQMYPAIYNDRIVWQDWRNKNFDIYMYNLSTCNETQIINSKSDEYYPTIYCNTIAWEDTRNTGVYVYNLSTSKKTPIAVDGVNTMYPAVYGDRIVWDDWRNVTGVNTNICMYNLSTSEEIQITIEESSQTHPAIHEDRIVWQDYRNGNADIYMCTVGSNFEDGGSNNNDETDRSSGGHSHGGGGGGAGGSPEPQTNVQVKGLSQAQVSNGKPVKFDFPKNATCVVYVSFDSKKTTGKIIAIAEQLKGKSSLVSEMDSGEVYKYFNLWVGNSGFATAKNIENPVVCFKVEKSWLQDKKIDQNSITLKSYSDKKWSQLPVTLLKEDDQHLYFTAQPSEFSFFAITGKAIEKENVTETQPKPDVENPSNNTENVEAGIKQTSEQKENTSTPGFQMIYGIIGLTGVFLRRSR